MANTAHELLINRFKTTNKAIIARDNFGIAAELHYHLSTIKLDRFTDIQGQEELRARSPITTGALSAWVHSPLNLSFGISIGSSFSPSIEIDAQRVFSVQAPYTTMNAKLPLTIRAEIEYNNRLYHGNYSFYRGLALNIVPEYTIVNSGNKRTTPLSLMEQYSTFSGGIHSKYDSLTMGFSIERQWGTTLSTGINPLPIIPEFLTYHSFIKGQFRKIFGHFLYKTGTSYIFGYDSEEIRDRFLILENLSHKRIYGTIGLRGNKLSGNLFTEHIKAQMHDYGYIDFYPFSSWTMFKPYAYRFSDGIFQFRNYGGEISLTQKRDKSTWDFTIRASFLTSALSVYRETKKIAVLIPVYTEDTAITYLDEGILLGDIKIQYSRNLKRGILTTAIKQLIPYHLYSNVDNSEVVIQDETDKINNSESSFFGGLTVNIGYTVPIGKNTNAQ